MTGNSSERKNLRENKNGSSDILEQRSQSKSTSREVLRERHQLRRLESLYPVCPYCMCSLSS